MAGAVHPGADVVAVGHALEPLGVVAGIAVAGGAAVFDCAAAVAGAVLAGTGIAVAFAATAAADHDQHRDRKQRTQNALYPWHADTPFWSE